MHLIFKGTFTSRFPITYIIPHFNLFVNRGDIKDAIYKLYNYIIT